MANAKVDIAVGGRFHADYMARALLSAPTDVQIYTTLPRGRFGSLRPHVHSFLLAEAVFRISKKMGLEQSGDRFKILSFGRYLAKSLRRDSDLLIGWSSFMREAFIENLGKVKVLVRDSAHIGLQYSLLEEEHRKFQIPFPNRKYVLERELEEYERADKIIVLSEFAKKSFLQRGIPEEKIEKIQLGVELSTFKPKSVFNHSPPFQVLYFGIQSLRKGVVYLLEATKDFSPSEIQLTLIGDIDPPFKKIVDLYPHARLIPAQNRERLSEIMQSMDIMVLPSVEDGFGQVAIQAMACGLLCIATQNCGASENIEQGKTGFVVPARDSKAIADCLKMLLDHPESVPQLSLAAMQTARSLSWHHYQSSIALWARPLLNN